MRGFVIRTPRPHPAGAVQRALWTMVLLGIAATAALGGTTGKLAGRVTDKAKQPLPGANIVINGTQLGAVSDLDGYYTILNIPPGRYQVRYAFIGYKTMTVSQILVTTDHTTTQDIQLEQSVIEGESVQVVAQRPIVETNLTSSVATVTSDAIAIMPVQDLQEVVDLQAGVVDGHFRGGRTGEVQYQINGVSVNNSYDNSSTLRIDRSLLQEVQVISGTFDAEYGQAMSGVVNVVLKSGSDKLAFSGEAYTSDYVYTTGDRRNAPDKFRPLSLQNYQASLSGPVPLLARTYFIFSGRHYANDGYVYGERRFLPTDRADFENKIYAPGGDGDEFPLDTSREWSGLAKITNRSLKNITLEYQAITNNIAGKRYNYGMRFNPDGRAEQKTFSIVHGLDVNHTLSPTTFYNVSLRQNYFNYSDYKYEDFYDARYDSAGPSMGDSNYEDGASIQGVELGRFKQQTNTLLLKGALTSQVSRSHQLKFGFELQKSELKFGSPGYLVNTGGTILVRHIDEPPDYPGIAEYNPVALVAYGQDQIEWRDLVVRAGARLEYFDARSTLPSDLANPANTIAGAPTSVPTDTKAKLSLSPRLGISYPVTTSASLFVAYGHFYQMPALGQIFSNSDYNILDDLQAGGISYGVLGNPDIKPERTVQYEFGYKQAIGSLLGLDVSIFYKDIRDLLGVEFVSTYAAAEYARLTNIDFGNVLGYTIALDQRRIGMVSTMIDYTWQRAQGNASDPRETATRASAGEDPRPRQIPLGWDQRNTLNATVTLESPNNFAVSTIIRYGSGQPYTPALSAGFGGGLETNSGRKPNGLRVDLRAEKYFKLSGIRASLFARVINLLDARFVNGFVFDDTGSPDYSLNPIGQRATLANPGRYYPPRRLEVGFTFGSL